MNTLAKEPDMLPAPLPQATHYHRLRRRRRVLKSLAEIVRIASELNDRVAAECDSVPDAIMDHLTTATTSLSACRLLLNRRANADAH